MSRKIRSSVLALLAAAGTASAQLDSVFADGWLDDGVNPASTLVLTTNNEQQQIEVEVGPQPGEVRVYGIDGIPSGTLFTGVTAIDLTTGRAQDYVEFRVYATVIPSIRVDTGAGNSDVKFIYFLPFSVAPVVSDVEVVGNAANDKVGFEVFNDADDITMNWVVKHGSGDNEVTVNIDSQEPTGAIAMNLFSTSGTGQDKLEANVISGAGVLDVTFGGRMGAGNDTAKLTIDEKFPGSATVFFDLNMGGGNDDADAVVVLRGGTANLFGAIAGGNGHDVLKLLLEGDGSSRVRLVGGAGNDYLDSEYKGRVTGAPRLLAGDGNDFLKIVADQPGAMKPYLDGGPGYDEAIGFGTIVNVEKIN